MTNIDIFLGDGSMTYNFASAEQAKAEYERIKKEVSAGNETFEITDKKKSGFYLVRNVQGIGLRE